MKTKNNLTVEFETTVTPSSLTALRLLKLLRLLQELKNPSRCSVAIAAHSAGLCQYVGGRHVAIHAESAHGAEFGVRLAVISGDFGDWL